MIVRGSRELLQNYDRLGPGDVFVGKVPGGPLRPARLIDLMGRGVDCLPSALSQTLNGSKAAQAEILYAWMPPLTRVIRRRIDLLDAMGPYHRQGVAGVVTKEDRMHCGHGVRRWDSLETLYNMVAFAKSGFPFVLQPFLERFTDVRAIIVGDYVEAYTRSNPDNFRRNLSAGGRSRPYTLKANEEEFCRAVMARGGFPYAHLDLQLLEDGRCFLTEIALEGGIKGARIDRPMLQKMKTAMLDELARRMAGGGEG